MHQLTLLFVLFTVLISCSENKTRYQIKCDSGFKSPLSYRVTSEAGIIQWKVNKGDFWTIREMVSGEICFMVKELIK